MAGLGSDLDADRASDPTPNDTPESLSGHACLYYRWSGTGKFEWWCMSRKNVELDSEPRSCRSRWSLSSTWRSGHGLVYTPTFTVRRQLASRDAAIRPRLLSARHRHDAGSVAIRPSSVYEAEDLRRLHGRKPAAAGGLGIALPTRRNGDLDAFFGRFHKAIKHLVRPDRILEGRYE
jgi:hypothetical protein